MMPTTAKNEIHPPVPEHGTAAIPARCPRAGGSLWLLAVFLAFAILVPAVFLTGCESAIKQQDPRKYKGLDHKLDAFTYLEEGKLVALAVSGQAARYRDADSYMPLAIGIANKGVATLHIDRESFLLYDETGRRYPLAPYSEVSERYHRSSADQNFDTFFQIWNAKWPTFTFTSSSFFPIRTNSVVHDFFELPRFFYTQEYMYFPKPETGILNHRFELHMKAQGLPDPVFVKFLVD